MSDKGTYGSSTGSVAVMLQPYPRLGSAVVIDWLMNELPSVHNSNPYQLLEHLRQRADHGREKHGTFLMAKNGREPRIDAYQEILDAIFYTGQAIMEGRESYRALLRVLIFAAENVRQDLEK